jgi:serine/threonine protein kinase
MIFFFLGDFGLAQFAQENDLLATPCGTSGYVGMHLILNVDVIKTSMKYFSLFTAPEVCMAEGSHYTRSVDLWSLGVILYILYVISKGKIRKNNLLFSS